MNNSRSTFSTQHFKGSDALRQTFNIINSCDSTVASTGNFFSSQGFRTKPKIQKHSYIFNSKTLNY